MSGELFREMKRYVGFDETDADALGSLKEVLSPYLPEVIEEFYAAIEQQSGLRQSLAVDEARMRRLRGKLLQWLHDLFSGVYDTYYFRRRCEIGRVHVAINLPQHYVFTAMNVLRLSLLRRIDVLNPPDAARKIAALHKILDLELATMNETYRDDLVGRIRATEHAQYEQRLHESEHLASVGQLAASLAHEIKNPLAGISGAVQILGSGLEEGHPHKEIIMEVLRQIDRLDAAVKDLLVYARPKPPTFKRQNLDAIVQRVLILLREEPSFRAVRVHCEGLDGEHQVVVDEPQMQQVFTNLFLNAAQACEGGSDVTCRIRPLQNKVRILIEDRGSGMPPEVLARCFEPFFTTKVRGTGLGLPICKRIVEAHDGTIEIQSFVGKGTRVTLEIPCEHGQTTNPDH